jgi:hypothetical protein
MSDEHKRFTVSDTRGGIHFQVIFAPTPNSGAHYVLRVVGGRPHTAEIAQRIADILNEHWGE